MFKTFIVILILNLGLVSSGKTQEYRLGLAPPSFEIYKSMLEFAENEKYDKISSSWKFLGDIPAEISNKFGVDFENEITGPDNGSIPS